MTGREDLLEVVSIRIPDAIRAGSTAVSGRVTGKYQKTKTKMRKLFPIRKGETVFFERHFV
jgi:hypothetical protein